MHNAPSVTYPVGRSRMLAGLIAALWLTGGMATAFWVFQTSGLGWRLGAEILALVFCGAWAARAWATMGVGALCWDGQDWQWSSAGRTVGGRLAVHLDAQTHLLLRFTPPRGAQCWCWAERASAPERWADLRRAVYSRAKTTASPQASPEAATP
jgi:toxin CptA